MKSIVILGAMVLMLGIMGCSRGSNLDLIEPTTTPGWDKLDAIVNEGVKRQVYPGAVLIVGKPDKVLWAKAYGRMTYEADAPPMQLDSIFDLASVSKVVGTTSAALLLLEDGTISLDDRVSMYIPGFEAGGKDTVTIRDLMTHVSGLKAYESRDKVEKTRREGESHADALIRTYASLETSYKPRKDLVYSCLNFQTTARVVENASGRRMEDLLKERVYGPIGMKDTVYTLTDAQKERVVPTLKRADGTLLVAEVHDPLANYHGFAEHCPGNAGVFAPATDVARYCGMVLNEGKLGGKRVYKEETIRMATAHQSPGEVNNMRGLGWGIYEAEPYITSLNKEPGHYVVGHTGYTGTLIWLDQHSKTFLVFFTNRVYPDDASKPEGELNITDVRKSLCEAVLRTLPEYKEYWEKKAAATYY